MPSRRCLSCNFMQYKDCYADGQWNREDKISFCRNCVTRKKESGTPYRCNNCGEWKGESAFAQQYQQNSCLRTRICCDCVERRVCRGICGQARDEHAFTAVEWEMARKPHERLGKCKNCMQRGKQEKKCSGPCQLCLAQDAFSEKQWEQGEGTRKCMTCALKKTNTWLCVECKKRKHKNEFSMW